MREPNQEIVPLDVRRNARAETQVVSLLSLLPMPSVGRLNKRGCTAESFQEERL